MEQKKKHGVLVYNQRLERLDIRYGLEKYNGGLHCGDPLEVKIGTNWKHTRIEKSDDWYLVGIKTDSLVGLKVRI